MNKKQLELTRLVLNLGEAGKNKNIARNTLRDKVEQLKRQEAQECINKGINEQLEYVLEIECQRLSRQWDKETDPVIKKELEEKITNLADERFRLIRDDCLKKGVPLVP